MKPLSNSEKSILLFLYTWERPIRAGDLFQILNLEYGFSRSRQTLHSLIKKLRKNHYLFWEPHKLVKLTDQGKEHALHIAWHMHLLEKYLEETLDLCEESIKKEALRLTPIISCNFINAINRKFHKNCCELEETIEAKNLCLKGNEEIIRGGNDLK